jgi:hypothetical protein
MSIEKKNPKTGSGMLSIAETNAMLAKELADEALKEQGLLPTSNEPETSEVPPPTTASVENQASSSASTGHELGSDGRPLFEPKGSIFSTNSHESDRTAKQVLTGLYREASSRFQDRSLILEDLKELGMAGQLSDDSQFITMPFEDVHRLVTTMRMAEIILNERVQSNRKAKIAQIKTQLDAEHCPDMSALFAELDKAKRSLLQKHPFQSIGAFEGHAYNFEGNILFKTMMIARVVTWLAMLSIDPNAETRRGTLSVFSELRASYSSQRTLHELYFHHHDEKQALGKRIRGAMNDLGDRLTKVAIAPTGNAIAKRQKVANELKSISNLVEEMLSITKESYNVSLTASHMGQLAFEHTVTISDLRSRIAELQTEIRSWVQAAILPRRDSCHGSRRRKRRFGESQWRAS